MKFVRSQTDFLINRIVKAVQLPVEHPFHVATQQLVDRMHRKFEEGSWIP